MEHSFTDSKFGLQRRCYLLNCVSLYYVGGNDN